MSQRAMAYGISQSYGFLLPTESVDSQKLWVITEYGLPEYKNAIVDSEIHVNDARRAFFARKTRATQDRLVARLLPRLSVYCEFCRR